MKTMHHHQIAEEAEHIDDQLTPASGTMPPEKAENQKRC